MENQPHQSTSRYNQFNQVPQNLGLQPASPTPNTTSRRYSSAQNQGITLNPFLIIGLLTFIAFVIFAVVTYFYSQKLPQIKIDNFTKYYSSIPKDYRESTQIMLYNTVEHNYIANKKLPKSGAVIRDSGRTSNYDDSTNTYTDSFIVDLESIQQSYYITVRWSSNSQEEEEITYDSYPIVILCPTAEQLIYPEFDCHDGYESTDKDNIYTGLPIEVSYYSDDYSEYTNYTIITRPISYVIALTKNYGLDTTALDQALAKSGDESEMIIFIQDFTGGNYDAAIKKLREANKNYDKYFIQYNDLSGNIGDSRP